MKLPRMRTLDQAHRMLKEMDPETAVTKHGLYVKLRSGELPCVMCGTKRLINYDLLLDMLNINNPQAEPEPPQSGKVRKVDWRR